MRTALITGAAGFCGPHLARRLRANGPIRLIGASRGSPCAADVSLWDKYVAVATLGAAETGELLRVHQPDWIFHLAGSFVGSEAELHAANVTTVEHLLGAVRAHAPKAMVLVVGSAAEYGSVPPEDLPVRETQLASPQSAYGRSKLAATRFALAQVREWGANVRVARPFNIIGAGVPASLVTGALISRVKDVIRGERTVVPVGNIDTQRDFVAVEDVVDAYVAMMRDDCAGEIANICSGHPRPIRSVIEVLRRVTGHPIPIVTDPGLVRSGDPLVSYGSPAKAKALCGFATKVTLEEALAAAWHHAAASTRPAYC